MNQKETVDTLSALANETRLAVYRVLTAAGEEGRRAGEIAEAVNTVPGSLSSHLATLTRVGLISRERRGTSIIYRAMPEKAEALARLLIQR